jgi:phosphohistidine phosphatase
MSADMRSKPSWFYRQSGVIPYRIVDDHVEVLLITSRRRGRWIIPKGIIDPGTTAAESAAKEAYEEAGIRGDVSSAPVGTYRYEKWGGECSVEVFLLKVHTELETWPEASVRQRRWLTITDAARAIEEPRVQELILAVPELKLS